MEIDKLKNRSESRYNMQKIMIKRKIEELLPNARLGTCLVRGLTKELLARNIVPFYSASITNIGSQMVANRCGYIPFWVDTFGTVLDGSSVYNHMVEDLSSKFMK